MTPEDEQFEKNWPVDLEEFFIIKDKKFEKDNPIPEDQKIWRIKSLRVQVDVDTRILLLPLPSAKRTKPVIDT